MGFERVDLDTAVDWAGKSGKMWRREEEAGRYCRREGGGGEGWGGRGQGEGQGEREGGRGGEGRAEGGREGRGGEGSGGDKLAS